MEGNNKDGKKDGLWTLWYENGQKKSEFYMNGEIFNGSFISWYESGNKKMEGNFKDRKRDGVFIYYDKTGEETSRESYFQGILKSELKSR